MGGDSGRRGRVADAVRHAVRGPGRGVDGREPGRQEVPALDDEAAVTAGVVRRHLEADEHELGEAGAKARGVGGERGRPGAQAGVAEEHLEACPARVVDDPRTDPVADLPFRRSSAPLDFSVSSAPAEDADTRFLETWMRPG
uniref:Uncharacterized protein n=1 Tax=Arundo donax TaxID=35708 RepID=A0A0A9DWK4_ARUDO